MPERPRTHLASLLFATCLGLSATAQNNPPNTPTINEPTAAGLTLHPQDVHMETAPFQDPDPGDVHLSSTWEIWRISPSELIWAAVDVTGPEKVHAHLGDGIFMGSHGGSTQLFDNTDYRLRVRHRDSSGDPATEWSGYAERTFRTGVASQISPLLLDDIADVPTVQWVDSNQAPYELPTGIVNPSLRVEGANGQLLLRIDASAAPGNTLTNPAAISAHQAVRVVIEAGQVGTFLLLQPTTLTFAEHGCDLHTILLPAVLVPANQTVVYWIARDGSSYVGNTSQTSPVFTNLARGQQQFRWISLQSGYSIEEVANDFQLPVNIAFVPNPGPNGTDPFFYVTELYGTIVTVLRNGQKVNYASNLLNYVPSGAFPGSGEQGLTGIAVDPVTGDVFAAMLQQGVGGNEPRIVRFSSVDGGRTAASQQTILYMPGEFQGQSHQISCLEIVNGLLYSHMGDGFTSSTAQNLNSYRGKILCLNLDGSAYAGNPFYDANNGITSRDYVSSYGVRNPFGGAWRAADGLRYCVENGPSIDRFSQLLPGRNYLWSGSDASMRNYAIYNWVPATGPVNIAFVQQQTFGGSGFPAAKWDHAFVSESGPTYATGPQSNGKRITEWILDASGNLVAGPLSFVQYVGTGRATAVGLTAGPDGLYFTELYRDIGTLPTARGASVFRIRFGVTNDCNTNGLPDPCEIALGLAQDCNGNQTPDTCDIQSGTSTDFDGNLIPDECDPLQADRDRISLSAGGAVAFSLHPGTTHAGRFYFLAGSATGTTPGFLLDGVRVPLNIAGDPWFPVMVQNANQGFLTTTAGTLDPMGEGQAAITVPPSTDPALTGATFHHAYVVLDPQAGFATVSASNAVPLTFEM